MTAALLALALVLGLARSAAAAGLKDAFAPLGLTPSLVYDGDVFADASGGAERGATYVGDLHLQLDFDGAKALGAPGLTAHVDGLWAHGGLPSALAGDAQGVSNIAAPAGVRLYEAWVQYSPPEGRVSVLAGRFDLNTEFYRLASAGLFVNSSFGMGPELSQSGLAGPSIFPDTSQGLRLAFKPSRGVVLRAAVMQAPSARPQGPAGPQDGGGVMVIGEAAFLARPSPGPESPMRFRIGRGANLPAYDDKLAVGGWWWTGRYPDLVALDALRRPVRRKGEGGAYVLADAVLFQGQGASKARVAGFLQLGAADDRTGRFGAYLGGGVTAKGLVPGRPDDELGLAVAHARNGGPYLEAQRLQGQPADRAETAIELTWLAQVRGWLSLQPDLQYVVHPNTDPRVQGALTFQLRFEAAF